MSDNVAGRVVVDGMAAWHRWWSRCRASAKLVLGGQHALLHARRNIDLLPRRPAKHLSPHAYELVDPSALCLAPLPDSASPRIPSAKVPALPPRRPLPHYHLSSASSVPLEASILRAPATPALPLHPRKQQPEVNHGTGTELLGTNIPPQESPGALPTALLSTMSLSIEELDATVRAFYEGRGEPVRTLQCLTACMSRPDY